MLVTTTPALDGLHVTRYLGVVGGEAILGADIFRDLFAGIRDIVGGRSAAYERQLQEAKQMAMDEMTHWAKLRGANAVIGVDADYETIGGSMLMVSVNGTAVYHEPDELQAVQSRRRDEMVDEFDPLLTPPNLGPPA